MKYFLSLVLVLCSMEIQAASLEVRAGQFSLKFENKTGDKEFEITAVKPVIICSTVYRGFFNDSAVVNNTRALQAMHFPESLHVGTAGFSYIQLSISGKETISSPNRAFYKEKNCKVNISFKAKVMDERSGDELSVGEVNATIFKTNREDVSFIDEINAMKVKKFSIEAVEGEIDFIFSEGGTYRLKKITTSSP